VAEDGSQTGDGGGERATRHAIRQQHGRGPLGRIERGGAQGDASTARPRHVRRANVAAAGSADVHARQGAGEQERKGDGADEIAAHDQHEKDH
jgi:hypothetical protein